MSLPAIQLNLNLQGEYQVIAEAFKSLALCIVIVGIINALCTCRWFNVQYVVYHRERYQHNEHIEIEMPVWRRLPEPN